NLASSTTNGVTTAYTFDALNRLTGVSAPGSMITYQYNALGARSASTQNGLEVLSLIDPLTGNLLAESAPGGQYTHYTFGLGLVSQVAASGSSYYYDFNQVGSTIGITDSSGHYVD